jgi:phosphoglycolate phosphatase-like HAD superfamily hydrolase
MNQLVKGHIIFDHDGTLVEVSAKSMKVFSKMRDLLILLKKFHLELHVWTAREKKSTLISLKENDIAEYFTGIYTSDDGLVKPHPMGLAQLTVGIDKKLIMHTGDSLSDYSGATSFGIDFVYAGWNNQSHCEYFRTKTNVAESICDLKNYIIKKYALKIED